MSVRNVAVALLALASAAPALGEDSKRTQVDDDHIREVLKGFIEAHPDVLFNAVNRYVAEARAAKEKEKGTAILQADPELAQADGLPSVGNPNGKLWMVYFLDGACSYCRRSAGVLEELAKKNPDLKIIHRWVPFLSPSSEYAGRVATLVARRYPASYPAFYAALMSQQGALSHQGIDAAVVSVLGEDALGPVRQESADKSDSNPYARSVAANNALARRLKVDGTPFFYVHGAGTDGVIAGATGFDRLASAVAKARAGGK